MCYKYKLDNNALYCQLYILFYINLFIIRLKIKIFKAHSENKSKDSDISIKSYLLTFFSNFKYSHAQ